MQQYKKDKRKWKKPAGVILIVAGLLFVAAGIWYFTARNRNDARAQEISAYYSEKILSNIETVWGSAEPADDEDRTQPGFNSTVYQKLDDMLTIDFDGEQFVGLIEIPSLALCLPVHEELNDTWLYQTPCRYAGSVYDDTLVIAGCAYDSQFLKLSQLSLGRQVIFVDFVGNEKHYKVSDMQTYTAEELDQLITGMEDNTALTLFSWSESGRNFLAVRCKADSR